MREIRSTAVFDKWLDGLKDKHAQHKIEARIIRLGLGLPGDVKPAREGVAETRIDWGPGYRVYFIKRGQTLYILLAGGDKSTQDRDIWTAVELARNL